LPEVQESVLEQPKEETRQDAQGLTPSIVRTSDTLPQSKHSCQVSNCKAAKTLEAINTMGVALADHNHHWSRKERRLYYGAYRWLTSVCDADSAA